MDAMPRHKDKNQEGRVLLESRLRYHYRCLREDATNPEVTCVERLALVRDRAERIREIRQELEAEQKKREKRGRTPGCGRVRAGAAPGFV